MPSGSPIQGHGLRFQETLVTPFKCKQPGPRPGILLISMHLLQAGVGDSGYRPPATDDQSDPPPWQVTVGGTGV